MSSPYEFSAATFQVGDEDPVVVESIHFVAGDRWLAATNSEVREAATESLLSSSRVIRDSMDVLVPRMSAAGTPPWVVGCEVCDSEVVEAHRLIGWFCPRVFFALRDRSLAEALLAVDIEMSLHPEPFFPCTMRGTLHSHPILWELLYQLSHVISEENMADDNCRLGFNVLVRNIVESAKHEQGESLCHCVPF